MEPGHRRRARHASPGSGRPIRRRDRRLPGGALLDAALRRLRPSLRGRRGWPCWSRSEELAAGPSRDRGSGRPRGRHALAARPDASARAIAATACGGGDRCAGCCGAGPDVPRARWPQGPGSPLCADQLPAGTGGGAHRFRGALDRHPRVGGLHERLVRGGQGRKRACTASRASAGLVPVGRRHLHPRVGRPPARGRRAATGAGAAPGAASTARTSAQHPRPRKSPAGRERPPRTRGQLVAAVGAGWGVSRRTPTIDDTPGSSIVTPYIQSAASIVRGLWVITTNWVRDLKP